MEKNKIGAKINSLKKNLLIQKNGKLNNLQKAIHVILDSQTLMH
jgi:hypothetical protein